MTDREKIIELFHKAKKADVICHRDGAELEWSDLEDFYHAAQAEAFEQAAVRVEDNYLEHYSLIAEAIRALKEK